MTTKIKMSIRNERRANYRRIKFTGPHAKDLVHYMRRDYKGHVKTEFSVWFDDVPSFISDAIQAVSTVALMASEPAELQIDADFTVYME